jgi:hypothetical protein
MDFFGFQDGFTWQDGVLTAGTLVFLVALLPTIVGSSKPAPLTSLSTGLVLLIFSGTYATLGLYFASVATFATAAAWGLILVQSLRAGQRLDSFRRSGEVPEPDRH